jgi:hypothetical protein
MGKFMEVENPFWNTFCYQDTSSNSPWILNYSKDSKSKLS